MNCLVTASVNKQTDNAGYSPCRCAPPPHPLNPRPAGTARETAEALWFWFGPSGWRALVVENGWSWERAEEFLCLTAAATPYQAASALGGGHQACPG
ncbi:hypothetical protein [Streptomyces sp. 142MFCol3.1]|uniref:hypothetical protein n=1 Tax=Streptomyces sp. 142MFCol3.1 TaxID=1172179 RepID=UPI001F37DF32|nr:hypothetical protein [Streptomyces sp. 142MFCol3.1]